MYKQILADKSNFESRNSLRTVSGFVVHYTANNNDTAEGNCNYFKRKNLNASAHYFVDDKQIVVSVMPNNVAWAVGTTKNKQKCEFTNNNTISIELCCKQDVEGNWFVSSKTRDNLFNVLEALVVKYGKLPLMRHYDITGKICPKPLVKSYTTWYNIVKEYILL